MGTNSVRSLGSNDVNIYHNAISIRTESRVANDVQLDETVTTHLFEEKRAKYETFVITDLCKCFLQICQRSNEHSCITVLLVFNSNFSVLKTFILGYKTVQSIHAKLREKSEKTIFRLILKTKSPTPQYSFLFNVR